MLNSLRRLPSVDRVLRTSAAARALGLYRHAHVADTIRAVLADTRAQMQATPDLRTPSADEVMATALARLDGAQKLPIRRVVNATGIVLHTNLGRAVLAETAVRAAAEAASGAVNLEYDIEHGRRGERDALVADDLCALTGAEHATIVNNNAAAVLLALNTLAEGREVIVSRGELIEIGGSFRIPDVMAKSGAVLREVGTTNRTHPRDYAAAISERTALILKVHRSNYRIIGFTREVALETLVDLGRERGIPIMEDLGSGALVDLSTHGLPKEPVVAERLRLGADLVTFSGDKLLGGPQAGLIVGRRKLVEAIAHNPLERALRCDKLTLAALAATLRLYRTAPDLCAVLPTLRWLTRSPAEMAEVGAQAVTLLRASLGPDYLVEMTDTQSEIGSGALPVETLPSKALSIAHARRTPQELAKLFRQAEPPIIGRVHAGRFWLDLRCIERAEELVPGQAVAD
jgi:L-seryl-tRNA(Ser) seleniumtransferase